MTAADVLRSLTSGRGSDKSAAIQAIDARLPSLDVEDLRGLIVRELRGRFAAPPQKRQEDIYTRDARCWLLSALGRIAADDDDAAKLVRSHLDPAVEPYYWARYWAFEGLITAQAEDLDALAVAVLGRKNEDLLLRFLASAVRASFGEPEALDVVRKALVWTDPEAPVPDNPGDCWAALRGLRFVPLPEPGIVNAMCAIVRSGKYTDLTYDAIVALGAIPPGEQAAQDAASVLADYVRAYRWPMYDSMRTHALAGLGRLKVQRCAPVLLEELLDDSPSIVHNAARALEQVLDTRMAARRVLEATEARPQEVSKFAAALRWMDRKVVNAELAAAMMSGPTEQRDAARALLSEIGGAEAHDKLRALTETAQRHAAAQAESDKRLDENFASVLNEPTKGFYLAIAMDVIVFAAGLILLGIGVYLVVSGQGAYDKFAGAIAGAGGLGGTILAKYLVRSRNRIEPSVRQLAGMKAIFQGYLRQLRQLDQAYTKRLLDEKELPAEELAKYVQLLELVTQQAVTSLHTPAKEKAAKPAATKPAEPPPAGTS